MKGRHEGEGEGHDLFMSVIGRTGEPRVSFALILKGRRVISALMIPIRRISSRIRRAYRDKILSRAFSISCEHRLMLAYSRGEDE